MLPCVSVFVLSQKMYIQIPFMSIVTIVYMYMYMRWLV